MTNETDWDGTYYDGVSAVPHRVTVRLSPTRLNITEKSGSTLSWDYADVRQTQGRYRGEEVRFERGTGICEALVIPNSEVLTNLHHIAPDHVTHFHSPARRHRRVMMTIVAGFASIPLLWATFTWGIPWLSGPIVALIPISWEEDLGQFMTTKLASLDKQCTDPKVLGPLESIVTTLTRSVESNPYTFRIHVVDSPTVNALAAPGGHILVFRGLLESTQTAEEMAGVLAHEMQHILHRHSMRLIVQQTSMGVVVGAISGDVSGIMTFGIQGAHLLQTLSYNRNVEEDADEYGMRLLLRAGIDPQGMLDFFQVIFAEPEEKGELSQRLSDYFTTHPSTRQRIHDLKALIPQTFKPTTTLLTNTDWIHTRGLCRSSEDTDA